MCLGMSSICVRVSVCVHLISSHQQFTWRCFEAVTFFCSLFQVECNLCQVWWSPKIWEHDLILWWVFLLCVSMLWTLLFSLNLHTRSTLACFTLMCCWTKFSLEFKKKTKPNLQILNLLVSLQNKRWYICQFVSYSHDVKTKNCFFLLLQILSCEAWASHRELTLHQVAFPGFHCSLEWI